MDEPNVPVGYKNWQRALQGEPLENVVEYALYSDVHVRGGADDLGPYSLINTLGQINAREHEARVVLLLRCRLPVDDHWEPDPMDETDDTTWHAGWIDDELTSLISLATGRRFQSGGSIREFQSDDDRFGRPTEYLHARPYLPPNRRPPMLPFMDATAIDDAVEVLSAYPSVPPDAAVTLLRAARAYQSALWLSEQDPEYAWLKLVSAVETAADYWWTRDPSPLDLLSEWDSELAILVQEQAEEAAAVKMAKRLVGVTLSGRKFREFLAEHAPEPPAVRPIHGLVDWDALPVAFRTIYGYRSKALHAAKPFPGPLLSSPMLSGAGEPPYEMPIGLASGVGDSVWVADDLPMHLHIFEYIVRESLKKWWSELARSVDT